MIERTIFDELREAELPRAAPEPEPDADPSWERIKARLDCDEPAWQTTPHHGWTYCQVCPRCAATLDENGEKP